MISMGTYLLSQPTGNRARPRFLTPNAKVCVVFGRHADALAGIHGVWGRRVRGVSNWSEVIQGMRRSAGRLWSELESGECSAKPLRHRDFSVFFVHENIEEFRLTSAPLCTPGAMADSMTAFWSREGVPLSWCLCRLRRLDGL
jgi:hypothetical protein